MDLKEQLNWAMVTEIRTVVVTGGSGVRVSWE
jgi:hypothetical protein